MQPRSHAFVIAAAVERAGEPALRRSLPGLLRGHEDEDDWVLGGVRLRAPGLTHTYRPGSRRGELLAPSALACMLRCVGRARRASGQREAAWWLGRACHLLGDMAVPARTLGVWHLLGDPFELWLEANVEALPSLLPAALALPEGSPADLAEALARASSALVADTTRTPWGAWLHARLRLGARLDDATAEAQARALVPLAVAHTAALLRGEARRAGPLVG